MDKGPGSAAAAALVATLGPAALDGGRTMTLLHIGAEAAVAHTRGGLSCTRWLLAPYWN